LQAGLWCWLQVPADGSPDKSSPWTADWALP